MVAVLSWAGEGEPPAGPHPTPSVVLPPDVASRVWRGIELGSPRDEVLSSGFGALDAELPGGGWPLRSLTEILSAQPALLEFRLLTPVLGPLMAQGRQVVLVGPPRLPHMPGLQLDGLDERRLVWIRAEAPSQRMWVTEQLIRAGSAGAVIAWLPQARQEQIRRLQVAAASNPGLAVLCRPEAARHEASAAPLRVLARVGLDWTLRAQVLKRRGPVHEDWAELPSIPGGLEAVITPRLQRPSRLLTQPVQPVLPEVTADVVGSPASSVRRSVVTPGR